MSGAAGSTSSSVDLPPWLQGKAQENLNRAQGVQNFNPIPFMGPQVAAINPMQQAGMQSAMDAGYAYGLANKMDVGSMLPTATDYGGGISGYSAFPMFEQGMAQFREKYPDQATLFDRFNAPTRTPVGGTANYGVTPAATGTAASATVANPYFGGLGSTTPTANDVFFGGQTGTSTSTGAPSLASVGTLWNYKDRGNDNFLSDIQSDKFDWEKVRFTATTKDEAWKQAEQAFVNEMGLFANVNDMRDYVSIVKAGDGNFRFEHNNGAGDLVNAAAIAALALGGAGLGMGLGGMFGSTAAGLGGLSLGATAGALGGGLLGAGIGNALTFDPSMYNIGTGQANINASGAVNPYLTGIGGTFSNNPYLTNVPQNTQVSQAAGSLLGSSGFGNTTPPLSESSGVVGPAETVNPWSSLIAQQAEESGTVTDKFGVTWNKNANGGWTSIYGSRDTFPPDVEGYDYGTIPGVDSRGFAYSPQQIERLLAQQNLG